MRKYLLFVLVAVLIVSCTDKKAKTIADYEQTIGETKTDLSLKVKSLDLVKSFTGNDSLKILLNGIKEKDFADIIKNQTLIANNDIKSASKNIEKYKNSENIYDQNIVSSNEELLKSSNHLLDVCTRAEKYLKTKNIVIANEWKCTYTIKNPLLNNATQEITKYYVFDKDNTKILSSSTEK